MAKILDFTGFSAYTWQMTHNFSKEHSTVHAPRSIGRFTFVLVVATWAFLGWIALPGRVVAQDLDCKDFVSRADAQRYFDDHGGSPTYNFNRLDGKDHDGRVCETYPYGSGASSGQQVPDAAQSGGTNSESTVATSTSALPETENSPPLADIDESPSLPGTGGLLALGAAGIGVVAYRRRQGSGAGFAAGDGASSARVPSARRSELMAMPYQQYLQTTEWAERRTEAIRKAGGRCQLCNSRSSLQVHHRTYQRRGDERSGDLTVLCATCHQRHHGSHPA